MSDGTGENTNFAHPIVPVLLGVLLVAGGGYLYWSGIQATANAEEIDATVLSSSVVDTDDTGSSQDATEFTVRVEYRYAYDGREYTSENLCPGAGTECEPSSDFRTDMQEFVANYPEGETVTAYVPPSTLERLPRRHRAVADISRDRRRRGPAIRTGSQATPR